MRNIYFTLLSLGFLFTSCESFVTKEKTALVSNEIGRVNLSGKWLAELQISASEHIPFVFEIRKNKICLINGEEKIEGGKISQMGRTSYIELPSFNAYLEIEKNGNTLSGKWFVRNKEGYSVNFIAKPYSGYRVFEYANPKVSFDGLWNIELNDKSKTNVVGKFIQKNDLLEGTLLSNTGDYRSMEGQVNGDSMLISSFVGSHSFMIKAKTKGDSIFGQFYSSKHYKVDFKGVKTDKINMQDPYSLTYVTKKIDSLIVNLEDIDGNITPENFSQYKDEVVLIQIMGSWCANCYDEALFFKELHNKYSEKGLRIMGLSYESSRSKTQALNSLEKFINNNKLPYSIRYAGPAKKETTSKQWSMLNKISSYPTSILINKKGKVVQIHTGFNGPSTGELYTKYTEEMNSKIQALLAE